MKTVKTFLPVFSGFYGTMWEFDEDYACDSEGVGFEDLEIDYRKYEWDTVEAICDKLTDLIPFIESIKLETIIRPREYNFRNDSADVTIEYNESLFLDYVYLNNEAIDGYLKETYTSRSGFISFYDNSFEQWQKNTKGFTEFDEHEFGAIVNAICLEVLEVDEWKLSEDIHSEEVHYYDYIEVLRRPIEQIFKEDEWDRSDFLCAKLIQALKVGFEPFGYLKVLFDLYSDRPDFEYYMAENYPRELIAGLDIECYSQNEIEEAIMYSYKMKGSLV